MGVEGVEGGDKGGREGGRFITIERQGSHVCKPGDLLQALLKPRLFVPLKPGFDLLEQLFVWAFFWKLLISSYIFLIQPSSLPHYVLEP